MWNDIKIFKKVRDNLQICTNLEPTAARMVFPCMDEPNFKSIIQASIFSEIQGHQVLSNTPCSKVTDNWWHFEPTPLMSTYLFAFVIGKFDYFECHTKSGVKVRSYTPKGDSKYSKYVTKIAAEVIDFCEEYFQIKYPLPKLDLVACHELDDEGMENWGLITLENSILADDPKCTPTESLH